MKQPERAALQCASCGAWHLAPVVAADGGGFLVQAGKRECCAAPALSLEIVRPDPDRAQ